ncbi:MAG: DUF6273 domain-containing protein [Saccharofermentans sp.]|nr:DUF6273 domain-containing protein [Saccharofermentans sp.]
MKRPIKRFLCSLIGISLIACSAGCSTNRYVTTQSATESTAAAEMTAQESAATEETAVKLENQSFKYRPGDIVTFGKYEQDNNKSNGKEDIEWIVLSRDRNKLLLISKMALDQKPYNEKKENVTWETCSLRKWLNESFYKDAFDEEDKGYIVSTSVTADKNPEYNTTPGNDTKDNVFLLSIAEYQKYFESVKGIMVKGTDYALSKEKKELNEFFFWWLRTPGQTNGYASQIIYNDADGNPVGIGEATVDCTKGCSYEDRCGGVRPAMWVELPDKYTTPGKQLKAWVLGYATARIFYDVSKDEQVWAEIPDIPGQIHYIDGFPSPVGEVRNTYETEEAITEWLKNKTGKENIGFGWGDDMLLMYKTGHLEKTGRMHLE